MLQACWLPTKNVFAEFLPCTEHCAKHGFNFQTQLTVISCHPDEVNKVERWNYLPISLWPVDANRWDSEWNAVYGQVTDTVVPHIHAQQRGGHKKFLHSVGASGRYLWAFRLSVSGSPSQNTPWPLPIFTLPLPCYRIPDSTGRHLTLLSLGSLP